LSFQIKDITPELENIGL